MSDVGNIEQNVTETSQSDTWTIRGLCSSDVPGMQRDFLPAGWTFIYYVRVGDFIKIGASDRWKRRINNMNTASPYQIDVLLVEINRPAFEKSLHKKFSNLRHRGEWFKVDDRLLDHISRRMDRDVANSRKFRVW